MHKVADQVASGITIPLLHIGDAAAVAVRDAGISRVGLLGTSFTMEQPFYRGYLHQQHGLDVIIPDAPERAEVHRIIYDELCAGQINEASRNTYRSVVQTLIDRGAGGIILGCTELALLLKPTDSPVPLFDTAALHVAAALDFALNRQGDE
jgi:aspartate racemase